MKHISVPIVTIKSVLFVQAEAEEVVEDLAHYTTYSNQMAAF